VITSIHNRRVAAAVRLKKRAIREKDRRFLVEGPQAVGEAIASGHLVHDVFYDSTLEAHLEGSLRAAADAGIPAHPVAPEVMGHLTSTVTPQGLVAVADFVDVALSEIPAGARCVPVLLQVRDPGNAGTILRSADAAGGEAVVFTRSSVDVYNPKTVRATAGSLFHLAVVREADPADAVRGLHDMGYIVLAADAEGTSSVHEVDLTARTAVLFGNEAAGLPDWALKLSDGTLRVPISGRAESLNLAAAATVVLFESARQRTPGLAQLVAGAAHDIRSPLTAMRGFASTLVSRWDRLSEDQRRMMLGGILEDGDRMAAVVSELVDAARLASGSLRLAPVPTELGEVARAVAGQAGASASSPVPVEVVGSVRAEVDADRFRMVLRALVEGAAWWAEEGPVRIELAPGPVVTVSRRGTALAEDEAAALFQPRQPGAGGGSKVGLYLAKGLVEAHGGRLTVEAGEALTFTVRLEPSVH
jgi:RNA methyltransferase, TrmH family